MSADQNADGHSVVVSPEALATAWRAVGRLLAVVAGAATALISLMGDTPVWVASARGGIVWLAVSFSTSVGAWLAFRTWIAPPIHVSEEPEPHAGEGANAVPTGKIF